MYVCMRVYIHIDVCIYVYTLQGQMQIKRGLIFPVENKRMDFSLFLLLIYLRNL